MSEIIAIHPANPQPRFIQQTVNIIQQGGVAVIPTDATYVFACQLGNKHALERIQKIRQLDEQHLFTLLCRDLSDIGTYAFVSNPIYRMLKKLTPGAFTFILPATREIPKRLLQTKRKTIGVRVPAELICQQLLTEMHEPLLSTTLQLPGQAWPLADPFDIQEQLANQVDVIIDSGNHGLETTTVIDCSTDNPTLIRQGKGDATLAGL
jgi:tRNA threonylcarbamoyl adenosine modification protein (Sua5/YciO/YrdC/YwlC family)